MLRRTLRTGALETAGAAILLVGFFSYAIAVTAESGWKPKFGVAYFGFISCIALGALVFAIRKLVRTRANLAAIPDLPRAALHRRS